MDDQTLQGAFLLACFLLCVAFLCGTGVDGCTVAQTEHAAAIKAGVGHWEADDDGTAKFVYGVKVVGGKSVEANP